MPYKRIKTSVGIIRACEVRVVVPVDTEEAGRYDIRVVARAWENRKSEGTSARVVQVRELLFVVDVRGKTVIDYLPKVARPVSSLVFRSTQGSEIQSAEGAISFRDVGNAVERVVDNPITPVPEDDVVEITGLAVRRKGGALGIIIAIALAILAIMWLI